VIAGAVGMAFAAALLGETAAGMILAVSGQCGRRDRGKQTLDGQTRPPGRCSWTCAVSASQPHGARSNPAAIHDAQGQAVAALDAIERAVEVEPNASFYRSGRAALAVNCPRRRQACIDFERREPRFPHVHDMISAAFTPVFAAAGPRERETLRRGRGPPPKPRHWQQRSRQPSA
jgi:hypothetical protein